jgi:predicted MPP superfamily phosphohydrolase
MDKPFTILHLSDSHIGSPKYSLEEDEVLRLLVADMRDVAEKQKLKPDLVIFNGDLVFGQFKQSPTPIKDQYARAQRWIKAIYDELGLLTSATPLMIVPGNHDRNLDKITEADINWIRTQTTPDGVFSAMDKNSLQWAHFIEPQSDWATFAKSQKHEEIQFNDILQFSILKLRWNQKLIGVGGLNSAWAAYKDAEEEKGKIWIGKLQMQKILHELADCDFTIIVSHHPTSWLTSIEEGWFEDRIKSKFDIHLHGHDHRAWFDDHIGHLRVAAGPCYAGAQKENGYSWIVIDFDQRDSKIHLRTYSDRGPGGWIPLVIRGKTNDLGIATISGLFQKEPQRTPSSKSPGTRLSPSARSAEYDRSPDFKELRDLNGYARVLEDAFGFQWEPWKKTNDHSKVIVYWPVRLRPPTLIHAVQCFAAAGFQRLGAKIVLCLDDLGHCDTKQSAFNSRANQWLKSVGSNSGKVQRYLFSQIIKPKTAPQVWQRVQSWLSSEDYKFDRVLRISKLEDAANLETLYKRRPRRLLTPALVWTCLDYLSRLNPDHKIVTLGGYDERELWEAWRDLTDSSQSHVGHIYVPELRETKDDQSRVLHMGHTDLKLNWRSKQDIRRAIEQDIAQGGDCFSESRLTGWCLRECVFLPQYLKGKQQQLEIGTKQITGVDDLTGIESSALGTAVSGWVAQWLL